MAVPLRRRLPGLKVRPGAVRRARAEAGLSLAGVARGDVSRTAIFLIETGKTHPTLPTLELIAERTGKPIEYFLDDEAPAAAPSIDFVELDQLLAEDRFAEVIALTSRLLEGRSSRADTARLRFLQGVAHIRTANAEAAEPLLRLAREHFEAAADRAMVVETLSWEVNIPYLLEDPSALAFAEAALEQCRRLNPAPVLTEVRILARIAGIHAFNHDWDSAIRVHELSLERLGPLHDMNRLAKTYGELGIAYRALGQHELSAKYSQKSIALHEMLRDRRSLALINSNLAMAMLNMNNVAGAEEHLKRSLELFEEVGVERGKSHVLIGMAELKLAKGLLRQAHDFSAQALTAASRNGERATEAEAHQCMGRVAAAEGDDDLCDREFRAAIGELEGLGLTERLIKAHATYAEILEERGDLVGAHQHLKQVVAASRPDLMAGRRERIEQAQLA
ncbi:MAG: hypothetical protein NVS9B1_13190 [Candidatus Dormibacteraceae bacterium]